MKEALKYFTLFTIPLITGAIFQISENKLGKTLIVCIGILLFYKLLEIFTGGINN